MNILVVEDNAAEQLIMREAYKQFPHDCHLSFTKDGVEALEFLRKETNFLNAPEVDFIILDLNLPRKNGQETLEEIKKDDRLKAIPVIILTGSCSPHELLRCYENGASFCLNKPTSFQDHINLARTLFDFVFTKVIFPPASLRHSRSSLSA
jgi:CheY-like chemotaxis protein